MGVWFCESVTGKLSSTDEVSELSVICRFLPYG
jgi:hypothetical protein